MNVVKTKKHTEPKFITVTYQPDSQYKFPNFENIVPEILYNA